jgi:1,4-dihydroxy-2-naphthoate octaprenyltransferase
MTTVSSKRGMFLSFNLLLLLPAAIVIVASLLKYGLGVDGLFDAIAPTMEKWGIKDPPGLNITSLIVFGPASVFIFSALKAVKLRFMHEKEKDSILVEIKADKMLRSLIVISILVLAVLGSYLFLENIPHLREA